MIEFAIEYDFGKITITENISISEHNEGISIDFHHNRKPLEIGKKIFNANNYNYIFNRVYSNAINPKVYLDLPAHQLQWL